MTRPRLSRAERARLAKQQRAEDAERQMAMIERDLAAIERLAGTALMAQIGYRKGMISKARCDAIATRLNRELDAMRDAHRP